MNDNINIVYQQKLSDQQFERLADFLYNGYGLKMPPTKKILHFSTKNIQFASSTR